jgi:uncharacterized membrane protein
MLALAIVGIADAFYVAQASYTGRPLWCPLIEGCNTVTQSPYARIVGVPLSYFGLIFYVSMFGLAALLALEPFARGLRLGAFIWAATGVSYSVYGMYLQLEKIQAVCIYCFISAVITILLFVAACRHLRATRVPLIGPRSPAPQPAPM